MGALAPLTRVLSLQFLYLLHSWVRLATLPAREIAPAIPL